MISFFCLPKAFSGHTGIIQSNALRSWARLEPKPEIIVIGDEIGIEEIVREIGAVWIKSVDKTDHGTPLLSHAFALAAKRATRPVLCYANSDIMFTNEIMEPIRQNVVRRSLVTGRRWDTDVAIPWDFAAADWEQSLKTLAASKGSLFRDDALDYFMFERRSPLTDLPPFAVGRPGWDNAFIYRARHFGLRVIDATNAIIAVHQNHDYNHIPKRTGHERWGGPEADANLALIDGTIRSFSLKDATHLLGKSGLTRADTELHRKRRRDVFGVLYPRTWRIVSLFLRTGSSVKRCGRLMGVSLKRMVTSFRQKS
jgi:hypothetical protein